MKYLLSVTFAFLFSFSCAYAQVNSDDFNIRVFGAVDSTPPTTPTLLTIDPVAPTQIDITWSSSTDDFALGGYSVLRDGTPIATTTLLSYSDTGLTPSTTYAYTVRAFDLANNYSTTSNSLATTTPDIPPPPPTPTTTAETGSEGTVARIVAEEFIVTPGVSTTSIELITARPARIELRWGRTTSYELGYIVRDAFSAEHLIELMELEPGTSYEYELIGYTPFGIETVVQRGNFTTVSPELSTAPANVSNFFVVQDGDDARLTWKLPVGADVAQVRIVRSHLGFPEYPQDGAIVYQGLAETAVDTDVLSLYSPVYYTAFVYDSKGNVSSGAITLVYAAYTADSEEGTGGIPPVRPPQIEIGNSDPIEEATSTVNQERVQPQMRMPSADDIAVLQGASVFTMNESDIALDPNQEFLVSIPSNTVAGNLKSIIVTVVDPTDQRVRHSYLLRINKDRSAYEALLPGMGVVGASRIVMEIYDYEAYVVAKYQAPLIFESSVQDIGTGDVMFPDRVFDRTNMILLGTILLFVISLILLLIYRSRGEDND